MKPSPLNKADQTMAELTKSPVSTTRSAEPFISTNRAAIGTAEKYGLVEITSWIMVKPSNAEAGAEARFRRTSRGRSVDCVASTPTAKALTAAAREAIFRKRRLEPRSRHADSLSSNSALETSGGSECQSKSSMIDGRADRWNRA